MISESDQFLEPLSDIQKFYDGSMIFITGATGFLGNVLLTKLLRSCPGVKTIYLLVRGKGEICATERFEQIFSEQIKNKIIEECPDYEKKIKLMVGDCLQSNLGLSAGDLSILENEIEIIFHVAATVKFNAPLTDAVNMNVRCTKDLLNIATSMKRLKVFAHVSTAFSNCVSRDQIMEQFYDTPISAHKLITLVKQLDEDIVEKITPYLLDTYPNTYIYTKAVTEDLCRSNWLDLPLLMFRPAVVISTAKEPYPGWINNIYGPTGVFLGAAVGLLRTIHTDENRIANIVPCDYVINSLIASACEVGKNWKKRNVLSNTECAKSDNNDNEKIMRIYNYSSSCSENPMTWRRFTDINAAVVEDYPFSVAFRPISFTINRYIFMHHLYCILFHTIPAVCIDFICKIRGVDSKLLAEYSKVHKLVSILRPFVKQDWLIDNSNVQSLWNKLSPRDKEIFYFNINELDWDQYAKDHIIGLRVFIMNDKLDTVPIARRKRTKLIWVYRVLVTVLCFGLFSVFLKFIKLMLL